MSICRRFQTRKIAHIFSLLQFCYLLYRINRSLNLAEKLHIGKARIFAHLNKFLSIQFGIADTNVLYLRVNALSTLNNVIKYRRHRVLRCTFKIYLFPYEPLISLIFRFFENIEARTKFKKSNAFY